MDFYLFTYYSLLPICLFPSTLYLCYMPVFIASLNSGSNANCYYAGNNDEGILIDAGLSCRETERRMKALGLQMEKVKAIFISHEHIDHITGMSGLSRKFRLPVYITETTLRCANMPLEPALV